MNTRIYFRGAVVRFRDSYQQSLGGKLAQVVRQSARTGGLLVRMLGDAPPYKVGSLVHVPPYGVEGVDPLIAELREARIKFGQPLGTLVEKYGAELVVVALGGEHITHSLLPPALLR